MDALRRLSASRPVLYVLAAIGFFGLNCVFLFYAVVHPDVMWAAFANPVSLVFILEAFLMMGLLAWLIAKARLTQPGWRLFVVLSIVGSLAFSVPAFLLMHLRKQGGPAPGTQSSATG